MRKKMTVIFMGIVVLILSISFLSLYIVFHTLYIQEEVNTLEHTIDLISIAPNDEEEFSQFLQESNIRLTIVDEQGNVVQDSYMKETENHLHRKEIELALKKGSGSQTRYSLTAQMNYLYVAKYLPEKHQIIRLAMPLSGLNESVARSIPLFFVVFIVSLVIAYVCIHRFSKVLLEPIHQISLKIRNKGKQPIVLDRYEYPELQEIASAIQEMDEKIHEQIDDLENDKQMKQLFFSNASHELKTPLTSIQGYAELLKEGNLSEEIKNDCLGRILIESQKMTRLIQDILMISRLESNEHNGQAEMIYMDDCVRSIIKRFIPLAKEKYVSIEQDLAPVRVYAYKPYMEELVSNLVHNAIIYNKENGKVKITLSSKEERMDLIVQDTGIGISEIDQEKVFQRFYRAEANTKKGTGLGLSIVKHITLFYNGSVDIRSQLNEGTTISVHLPIMYN